MSLRLKLALAIATIAGLVAGLTGVVVYDREKSDRHDRARRGVAQTVRIYAQILSDPDLTSAAVRARSSRLRTGPTTRRSRPRCARS